MGSRAQKQLAAVVTYVVLGILVVVVLFPFYWMFVTSFRSTMESFSRHIGLWPRQFVLTHYRQLLTKTNFLRWFANSWLIAILTTLLSVAVGVVAAYGLSRIRFRGRDVVAQGILVTYLVPRTLLFIPLFNVLRQFGLINTYLGLVLAYATFAVPFATWMLLGYFQTVSRELDEAARIDGCSRWGTLLRVILPVSLPGVVASGIFSFNLANNEYLYALAFINSERLATLPRGISSMIMGDVYLWGLMMAACLLSSAPLVILYVFVQRYIVSGMTAGSVKG